MITDEPVLEDDRTLKLTLPTDVGNAVMDSVLVSLDPADIGKTVPLAKMTSISISPQPL
jgi:hypothetical protein